MAPVNYGLVAEREFAPLHQDHEIVDLTIRVVRLSEVAASQRQALSARGLRSVFDEKNPLYRFYYEVINQKKFEVLDELYAPGYINHIAPFGLQSDVDGVKKLLKAQAAAFPDWHITVDYVIEHGEKTIVKWTLTGTHTGDYFGYRPTGKAFKISGVDIETIVDGKITEHDGAEDMLGLLQQIGAVPLTFERS